MAKLTKGFVDAVEIRHKDYVVWDDGLPDFELRVLASGKRSWAPRRYDAFTGVARRPIPEVPMHLDAVLADDPLVGGLTPRLGIEYLKTLTIIGLPSATWPGLLDELNA